MTTYLGLDLSKRSTGFAVWDDSTVKPTIGYWPLGDEMTTEGMTFLRLHQNLNDLYAVTPFDSVCYEEPLNLGIEGGGTNANTLFLLIGLAAHVDSFCTAKERLLQRRIKVRQCNQASWRGHYLGSIPRGPIKDAMGNKIKRKAIDWKGLSMERARHFEMNPRRHDEAEAFGVLDYMVDLAGVTPPWRIDNPLVEQFGRRA